MKEDDEQTKWNGASGRAWVDEQPLLDRILEPFLALLVDAVSARSRRHVLDVGCGTGSTTLAVARLLGANDHVVGIDLSEPMIATARARAEREGTPASFICANAQTYGFEPATFDMLISRFGVMFFDDPVHAFANLRRASTNDAEVRFIAWRSAAENPFMTTAERAAAPLVPALPPRRTGAPGQFAFANSDHVRRILEASGWTEIDIRPIDVECALPETDLLRYVTRLGPVGMILQDVDDSTRARVIPTVRAAFDPYVHGDDVRFIGACWMIAAHAG
jgi:ubiquinone/menaquinone biosynthesis C-methylase UbiE